MEETNTGKGNKYFQETLWSVILKAQDKTSPDYHGALEYLISTYWKPVYFYTRRKGYDIETAKDLTQTFFTVFMEKDFLKGVSRERGMFRTFILLALNRFLSNQREYSRAQKRGGGKEILPLDFSNLETDISFEPQTNETPEKILNREWCLAILQKALENLRSELADQSGNTRFEVFKAYLTHQQNNQTIAYRDIAEKLNISETDVTNYLHRARKRYRELIESEIRKYVLDEQDMEEEISELFSALTKSC